jgi:glycosyltransferase involved in cell wall biosynthesis
LKHLYKIFVIPHGNYINFYTNTISSEEAKKRLMLPTKSIIFLFLGELRPYKGILELIQSFKKLNIFNSQNIGLVIAGRPINKQFAEKIKIVSGKNDNIYLSLESIPDNDLQIYLNAANIVVFPYKKVLTSGATLLALSFGKPIIAPSLGCIQDVFDKHGSFLYDPKDTKGLYGAMEKAITKRSNFRQMSIYNLEQAYKFNWQDIASRTHNVYLQILRK